jgi:diguanylate cyclase (GGDEF)-like protein
MRIWIINGLFSLLIGSVSTAIGWWLRGRVEQCAGNQHKRLVKDALENLQECTSKIRTRIAAHSNDVAKVAEVLNDQAAGDGSIVELAASKIVSASDRVRVQLAEVEQKLQVESVVIGRSISEHKPEWLIFKRMDRKKRLYRKVLCSLELLANDLAADVDEHRSQVEEIGDVMSVGEPQESTHIMEAVSQIINATSNMQEQIGRVELQLEEQIAQVEKHATLASRDALTGLHNRRTFDKELWRLHDQFQSHRQPFSLILLDVDNFKNINDQNGHPVGDVVLCELGKMLLSQLRDSDVAIAARYGGEEFAILLRFTSEFDAKLVAERIRKTCAVKQIKTAEKRLRITVSVGVSFVADGHSLETIVQRADQALYAAKDAGRNQTYWHNGSDCIPFGKSKPDPIKLATDTSESTKVGARRAGDKGSQTQESLGESMVIPPEFELSNRSIFCTNVNRRITEWQRGGPSISLLLLRIDQANDITNQHGESATFQLHAALCRLLAAFTREMDDRCEFDANTYAILLPDSYRKNLSEIGERLRMGVSECQMQFGSRQWKLTASVGISSTDVGDSGMELMRRGELAVQAASDQGGNTTYLADGSGVTRVIALSLPI